LVVGTSKRAVASTKTRRNGAWVPAEWTDANDKMTAAAYFLPLSSRLRLQQSDLHEQACEVVDT
jgi:hypothetical protein